MPDATEHSLISSYREVVLEHLLAGALMRELWLSDVRRIEVLKPQVDDSGYDLVLEAERVARHVQLKASFVGSEVREVTVNRALSDKPSGCVVFRRFDASTLEFSEFGYFGGEPGCRLPSLSGFKQARHTRANAKGIKALRPNISIVPVSKFEYVNSIADLALKLFGGTVRAQG
jgi:hypothetical protein